MHGNSFSRNFWKNRTVFPRSFSALWNKTIRKKKRDIFPRFHIFYTPERFWNTRVLPTEVFGTARQKNSDKNVMPPSYAWNVSSPDFFRNTEGFHYEVFRHCKTNKFRRKNVIPSLLSMYIFHTGIFLTQKGPPTYFFLELCAKKNWKYRDAPNPTLLCMKNFSNRIFSKHRRFPLSFFPVL